MHFEYKKKILILIQMALCVNALGVYFEKYIVLRNTVNALSTFVQRGHHLKLRVLLKTFLLCGNDCLCINIMPSNITD